MWATTPLRFALTVMVFGLAALAPSPLAGERPDYAALSGPLDLQRAVRRPKVDQAAVVNTALADCGSSLTAVQRRVIAKVIVDESTRHGYDPLFVQAMIEVESTCRPTARSPAGAIGLIQLIPSTARDVARRSGMRWEGTEGLLRPEVSVQIGLKYLAELEDQFSDPRLAVAAFNLGPGRVAGMDPARARRSVYVRKVLGRYEGLLEEHATTRS